MMYTKNSASANYYFAAQVHADDHETNTPTSTNSGRALRKQYQPQRRLVGGSIPPAPNDEASTQEAPNIANHVKTGTYKTGDECRQNGEGAKADTSPTRANTYTTDASGHACVETTNDKRNDNDTTTRTDCKRVTESRAQTRELDKRVSWCNNEHQRYESVRTQYPNTRGRKTTRGRGRSPTGTTTRPGWSDNNVAIDKARERAMKKARDRRHRRATKWATDT